jgi:hypothetical protein
MQTISRRRALTAPARKVARRRRADARGYGARQRREPRLAIERLSGRERPVLREHFLQLGDDRALDAKVQVLDRVTAMVGEQMVPLDVQAAGDGEA